ncbi:MAG: NAD(P)/FAD-dependent oxidoreductase [Deltaproteobacteria bacterium]|nr:NAD(P)/FAD-dependent oxidoreductase [Deltaproteobacteria bacterium]MBI3390382.1 NAD(P)/FAD-dependent oxidoreductase [Deltaproteobacteria bacterium]
MNENCDIAVIGAGAAGLAAGIFAAEAARAEGRSLRVLLLESAPKVGAKILISGGGRCNVTHAAVRPSDFNGSPPVVRNILAAFDEHATVRWFASLGVELKREATGKLFPVSDRAQTVLTALLGRCGELGVAIRTECRVQNLTGDEASGFSIQHIHGALHARIVIMATGGRSLPRTGSDGQGWMIAQRLGHSVTPTFPALVPLVLADTMFHAELSGLSSEVELSTFVDGKLRDRRTGSLLFTHFGISGPAVMDASRHWTLARGSEQRVEMQGNFMPGDTFEQIEQRLIANAESRPRLSIGKLLAEMFPDRLAAALIHVAEMEAQQPLAQLSRAQRRALAHALTALWLPIERDRGWDFAEVTAGGVPLNEIDYRTMASRKISGLYLIGEMLDCDGRIGGFNFQWAWSTGYLAGRAAARAAILADPGNGAPL